ASAARCGLLREPEADPGRPERSKRKCRCASRRFARRKSAGNPPRDSTVRFPPLAATDKYGDPVIIWAGYNDISGNLSADEPTILANIASMVAVLTKPNYL